MAEIKIENVPPNSFPVKPIKYVRTTKEITKQELHQLIIWLHDQNISLRYLHVEFSDAVPMVRLLKKFYPKFVELHNYTRCHNLPQKLENWETLNKKVLTKLGLARRKSQLNNLARGIPGELECLLHQFRTSLPLSKQCLENAGSKLNYDDIIIEDAIWSKNCKVLTMTIRTKNDKNEEIEQVKKLIRYDVYLNVVNGVRRKNAILQASNQKIVHMENLCRVMDEQILDLTKRIQLMKLEKSPKRKLSKRKSL